jgi:hypothetical protein
MIVLCCDTIVLCFTKLQGAVHIIEITQHSSRPPPLRDNSLDCCRAFVPSLRRAVALIHHMTVPGAVSSPWCFSYLSNRPAVGGFPNHLVTRPQRETAPLLSVNVQQPKNSCTCLREIVCRGADKSLAFPLSSFYICSTTKRFCLGWVKEIRTTKS